MTSSSIVIILLVSISVLAIPAVFGYYLTWYLFFPKQVRVLINSASNPEKLSSGDSQRIAGEIAEFEPRMRSSFVRLFVAVGAAFAASFILIFFGPLILDYNATQILRTTSSFVLLLSPGFAIGAYVSRGRMAGRIKEARFALGTREKIISSIDDSRLRDATYARHTQAERNEIRYRRNLSSVFSIKTFRLHKASIFSDVAWNLEPGVNVLLGRNGFGKSLLLRLLVGMISNDDDQLTAMLSKPDEEQRLSVWLFKDGEPTAIERDQKAFVESVGKIAVLAIPDSRFINRTRDGVSAEGDDNTDPARDGARHLLYELPYEARLQTVLAQMCIEYINSRERDASNTPRPPPKTPQLDMVSDVIQKLSSERFSFARIEPIGSARFSIEVETDASPGRPISIQHASQGTLSVVAIFGLIYQYLTAVYPSAKASEIRHKPGIVIIDEVDAHLHPAWQRKIVELLRERFPNIQFILTAHSPLVVAGCRSGEVTLLRREESGLRIVDFQRDFVGAMPEEIYRQVFEIEERDVRFLDLQAQIPQLPGLIRDLEAKKSQKNADVSELEKTIKSIQKTQEDQKSKVTYEALQLENEQLRRQLEATQRKTGGSVSS